MRAILASRAGRAGRAGSGVGRELAADFGMVAARQWLGVLSDGRFEPPDVLRATSSRQSTRPATGSCPIERSSGRKTAGRGGARRGRDGLRALQPMVGGNRTETVGGFARALTPPSRPVETTARRREGVLSSAARVRRAPATGLATLTRSRDDAALCCGPRLRRAALWRTAGVVTGHCAGTSGRVASRLGPRSEDRRAARADRPRRARVTLARSSRPDTSRPASTAAGPVALVAYEDAAAWLARAATLTRSRDSRVRHLGAHHLQFGRRRAVF